MKLSDLIKKTKLEMQNLPIDVSEFEIKEMISSAMGVPFESLSSYSMREVSPEAQQVFDSFIEKRKTGYPTAYIIKERGFFKREFIVEEGVLIPRPETEGLVEIALEFLKNQMIQQNLLSPSNPISQRSEQTQLNEQSQLSQKVIHIADLGCGSGCIGLSLLLELPNSMGYLFDISEKAIEVTQKNIQKFDLTSRARAMVLDISKKLGGDSNGREDINKNIEHAGKMDMVVSNPPYIAKDSKEVAPDVVQFEPKIALFGGEEGWEIYNSWSQAAHRLLKPGGYWCTEIGYDQGTILLNLIASQNVWRDIEIRKDLCGQDRYLLAQKRG